MGFKTSVWVSFVLLLEKLLLFLVSPKPSSDRLRISLRHRRKGSCNLLSLHFYFVKIFEET